MRMLKEARACRTDGNALQPFSFVRTWYSADPSSGRIYRQAVRLTSEHGCCPLISYGAN